MVAAISDFQDILFHFAIRQLPFCCFCCQASIIKILAFHCNIPKVSSDIWELLLVTIEYTKQCWTHYNKAVTSFICTHLPTQSETESEKVKHAFQLLLKAVHYVFKTFQMSSRSLEKKNWSDSEARKVQDTSCIFLLTKWCFRRKQYCLHGLVVVCDNTIPFNFRLLVSFRELAKDKIQVST